MITTSNSSTFFHDYVKLQAVVFSLSWQKNYRSNLYRATTLLSILLGITIHRKIVQKYLYSSNNYFILIRSSELVLNKHWQELCTGATTMKNIEGITIPHIISLKVRNTPQHFTYTLSQRSSLGSQPSCFL